LLFLLCASIGICAEPMVKKSKQNVVCVLPSPEKTDGKALNTLLSERHSTRKFKKDKLSLQQISNILWAANGINRADGKRTAPSALNRQSIGIYVLLEDGAYLWNHKTNKLEMMSSSDLRADASRYPAPLVLVLTGSAPDPNFPVNFSLIDCGYVSQNIYLSCASAGLGTCACGGIVNPKKLAKELKIDSNRILIICHPVGKPE